MVSIFLRIITLLVVFQNVVYWINLWIWVSSLYSPLILGGIVFQIVYIVGVYTVIHILWIRSSDIARQNSSEFMILHVVSILLRMVGELLASVLTIFGSGWAILILFAGDFSSLNPFRFLISNYFLSAIFLIILSLSLSFFFLIGFYFLAEAVLVQVDIAKNTRVIRRYIEQNLNPPQIP
jgi:hypothetical protein